MQSGYDKLDETFNAVAKRIKFYFEQEFGAARVNAASSVSDGAYVLANGDVLGDSSALITVELKKY